MPSANSKHVANLVFVFGITGILFIFWVSFGSQLEGRFLPVVTDLELEDVMQRDDGVVVMTPSFRRHRSSCRFVDMHFYFGDRGGRFTRVEENYQWLSAVQVTPESYPAGTIVTAPWHLSISNGKLTKDDLMCNSFAYTLHRCNSFFLTRTLVWDRQSCELSP